MRPLVTQRIAAHTPLCRQQAKRSITLATAFKRLVSVVHPRRTLPPMSSSSSSVRPSFFSTMSAPASAAKLSSPFTGPEQDMAREFLNFKNASPSQFHAVETTVKALDAHGFKRVSERDPNWKIEAGGKYYLTRNQSSIIAFAVGGSWRPGSGFAITAAHTDSPVLKIKPVSKVTKQGYLQAGVELYGGGLWHTWFDRDLTLAGRVIVDAGEGKFDSRLVHINRPILRLPTLAIHLNREVNDKGFIFNKEKHLVPVLATTVADKLNAKATGQPASSDKKSPEWDATPKNDISSPQSPPFPELHHSVLIAMLARELDVPPQAIVDFELCLTDTQPACLGGAYEEFIFSRALDNLMMSFVSIRSLLASLEDGEAFAKEKLIRVVALYDNEECGSASIMGAGSNHMYQMLNRLNGDSNSYDAAIARSFLVSADMSHGVHPNYSEVHEDNHRPMLHGGLVLKQNANQRYATSGISGFLLEQIARNHQIPTQKFVVRNDMGCGSTIGPILATSTGMRTVDVGIPQLSMHSIREMCGIADVYSAVKLLTAFYREFAEMDEKLRVAGEN